MARWSNPWAGNCYLSTRSRGQAVARIGGAADRRAEARGSRGIQRPQARTQRKPATCARRCATNCCRGLHPAGDRQGVDRSARQAAGDRHDHAGEAGRSVAGAGALAGWFRPGAAETESSPQAAMAAWPLENGRRARSTSTGNANSRAPPTTCRRACVTRVTTWTCPKPAPCREGGKMPTRLALTWGRQVGFVLTDAMQVKKNPLPDGGSAMRAPRKKIA